jgi:Protein of unknown function (DUF2939)
MRKTIFIVGILALAWLGYTALPPYDIFVLVRAFETRNIETLEQHVYFDSVRRSLSGRCIHPAFRHSTAPVGASCARRDPRDRRGHIALRLCPSS